MSLPPGGWGLLWSLQLDGSKTQVWSHRSQREDVALRGRAGGNPEASIPLQESLPLDEGQGCPLAKLKGKRPITLKICQQQLDVH